MAHSEIGTEARRPAAPATPPAGVGAERRVRMRDGRTLGLAEYGAPDGTPLMLFHGLFGSRLQRHPDDGIAARLGVRLIIPERPGFGLSDFQAHRRLLDWPHDVAAMADALGLARFAVLGISGGGPYAAACAVSIPERVTQVGLVSAVGQIDDLASAKGVSWPNRMLFVLARRAPRFLRLAIKAARLGADHAPAQFFSRLAKSLCPRDRAILLRADVQALLIADMHEAFKDGGQGVAADVAVLGAPWGFEPRQIDARVHLWHGSADTMVPLSMAYRTAKALPHCQAHFLPGEGHFLVIDHWSDILRSLTATWQD